MLKLINFLRTIVSNIKIQGCHVIGEKDEKLEHLHLGRQRLRAENLGSRYASSSAHRARAVKKNASPHTPVVALRLRARKTIYGDTVTMYQRIGCEPEPNCRVFSCGLHSRRVSAPPAGFHSGSKLHGRGCMRSFLHPALAVKVAQHDGSVVEREPDPESVEGEERQDRPKPHTLEQIVEWPEKQAPKPMPVAEYYLGLAVETPLRTDGHFQLSPCKIG